MNGQLMVLDHKVIRNRTACPVQEYLCETSYLVVNDSDHPSVQIKSFMKGKKVKKEEM